MVHVCKRRECHDLIPLYKRFQRGAQNKKRRRIRNTFIDPNVFTHKQANNMVHWPLFIVQMYMYIGG